MALKIGLAFVLAVSVLFVGLIAVSYQAQSVEDTTDTQLQNQSYDAAEGVYEGAGAVFGPAVVLTGAIAFLLAACGLAVAIARGGGR